MKKSFQDNNLDNLDISSKNEFENTNIKTTNINILLNRVKVEQKNKIRKNFIITAGAIGTLAITGLISII